MRSRRWRGERYQSWRCERVARCSTEWAEDFHPIGCARAGSTAHQEAKGIWRGWAWSVNDQTTSSMKAEGIKRQHRLPQCSEFLPFDPVPSRPRPRVFLQYALQTLPERGRTLPARNQLGRRVQRARSAAWIHFAPFSLPKLAANIVPEIGAIIPFFGMTCSVLFRQQASLLLMLHGLFQTFWSLTSIDLWT